ncbi:MAG: glycosyltransferase 87 family protein [Sumerlaeia bacterium]
MKPNAPFEPKVIPLSILLLAIITGACGFFAAISIGFVPTDPEITYRAAGRLRGFLAFGMPVWTLAWAGLAWLWWGRALRWRGGGAERWLVVWAGALILGASLCPPMLSDDAYRYAWEGLVVLSGENPYALAPADPALAGLAALHPDIFPHINHPEFSAIYPPLAQAVFAVGALAPFELVAIKVLLALVVLASLGLFWRLLEARGLASGRVLVLAAHPLVLLEGAFTAHVDVLLMAGGLLAAWALARPEGDPPRRWALAACGLAIAVLSKLAPLVLLPHLLRHLAGWRARALAAVATGALVLLFYLPFLGPGLFQSFDTYNKVWEFNGAAYPALVAGWEAVSPGGDRIVAGIDAAGRIVGVDGLSTRLRAAKHADPVYPPKLAARLTAAGLFGVAWLAAFAARGPRFEERWLWVVGAGLVLSPVVHPWYLLSLLPFALLGGSRAGWAALAWATAAPWTYAVLPQWWTEGVWALPGWVLALEYGAVAVAFGAAWVAGRRAGVPSEPSNPPDRPAPESASESP